jgi:hypothetical protein
MKKLSLLLLLLAVLAGCKKKTTSVADVISQTWKVASVTLNGAADPANYDKYRLTLNSNGNYTLVNENGQTSTGTWKLTDNDTAISFDEGAANARKATIQTAASGNLDITYSEKNFKNGDVVRVFKLTPA